MKGGRDEGREGGRKGGTGVPEYFNNIHNKINSNWV